MFHGRCRDLETALQRQVDDLRQENAALLDRILALTNPMAARAVVSAAPAASMPTIPRNVVRPPLPLNRQRPEPPPRPVPALAPTPIDYRAIAKRREVSMRAASGGAVTASEALEPQTMSNVPDDLIDDES